MCLDCPESSALCRAAQKLRLQSRSCALDLKNALPHAKSGNRLVRLTTGHIRCVQLRGMECCDHLFVHELLRASDFSSVVSAGVWFNNHSHLIIF